MVAETSWTRIPFEAYRGAPHTYTITDRLAFWSLDGALNGMATWGPQDAVTTRTLAAAIDHVLRPEVSPRDGLLDLRRVTFIEPAAFTLFEAHLRDRRAAYGRVLRRQVVLRPGGLVGAATAGFFALLPSAWEVGVFEDAGEALAWLGRPDALPILGVLDAAAERDDRMPTTALLGRWLEGKLDRPGVSLASAARALATSVRSLQRKLEGESTSFQRELMRARLLAARLRLVESDDKLEVVARRSGFATSQHFSVAFRRHFGLPPSTFRAQHRSPRRATP